MMYKVLTEFRCEPMLPALPCIVYPKKLVPKFLHLGIYIADINIPTNAIVKSGKIPGTFNASDIRIMDIQPYAEHSLFTDYGWCMLAVEHNGYALRYIQTQTEGICLNAVKHHPWALEFVRNQSVEICLAAVSRNGYALKHVHKQTMAICTAAILNCPQAIDMVDDQFYDECCARIRL